MAASSPAQAPTPTAQETPRAALTRLRGSRRAEGFSAAPDLVGGLDDQAQLRDLVLAREEIALDGGGKAALRRQAELVQVDIPRGLLDTALQHVFVLELGALRGNEPEDHLLSLWDEAQRLKCAGALVVVLEEEAIDF